MLLVIPSDVLRPRRPDEHFAAEAQAARDAGIEVALVDHDALATPGGATGAVARVPEGHEAVYRGWMLNAERYTDFEAALTRRDVTLRTTADQYRRAHELPGWYDDLTSVTPPSVWTVGDSHAAFEQARAALGSGPAVLRDYTKSMKHYWNEAAFIPDLTDATAAWTVASHFRELRDEDMTGGFVLRRYEQFLGAEARTWWVDGACRLIGPHPDTPHDLPPADLDMAPVEELIARIGLPFVTVDLARRDDGAWRVVELGDGQVSDRPQTMPPQELITALLSARPAR